MALVKVLQKARTLEEKVQLKEKQIEAQEAHITKQKRFILTMTVGVPLLCVPLCIVVSFAVDLLNHMHVARGQAEAPKQ